MKLFKATSYCLPLSLLTLIVGCKDDSLSSQVMTFNAPDRSYYFERDGKSSVRNDGQTVRNLLIQDFKMLLDQLKNPNASPVNYEELYRYYDNNGQTLAQETATVVKGKIETKRLDWLAGRRDLKGKVNPQYGNEITANISQWCQKIADNTQDPNKLGKWQVVIDEKTGYDLSEMIHKTLLGGVAFSHGLHSYFRKVEEKNNESLMDYGVEIANYTEMEHHLDETFGYTGAARNFYDFTDEEIADIENGKNYKDNFIIDGKIDFKKEYNFSFIVEAAKRDLSAESELDYTTAIFEGFRQARQAIVDKDYEKLLEQKEIILDNWEEVIAATAIHHINQVLMELDTLQKMPKRKPNQFYKHWSAMYKYVEALRYNYNNRLIDLDLILHRYMETAEVPFPKAIAEERSKIRNYKGRLMIARYNIQITYGFSTEDVEAW